MFLSIVNRYHYNFRPSRKIWYTVKKGIIFMVHNQCSKLDVLFWIIYHMLCKLMLTCISYLMFVYMLTHNIWIEMALIVIDKSVEVCLVNREPVFVVHRTWNLCSLLYQKGQMQATEISCWHSSVFVFFYHFPLIFYHVPLNLRLPRFFKKIFKIWLHHLLYEAINWRIFMITLWWIILLEFL